MMLPGPLSAGGGRPPAAGGPPRAGRRRRPGSLPVAGGRRLHCHGESAQGSEPEVSVTRADSERPGPSHVAAFRVSNRRDRDSSSAVTQAGSPSGVTAYK
jgi:hypothetical protein